MPEPHLAHRSVSTFTDEPALRRALRAAVVAAGLSGAMVPAAEATCYRVATWSLEAFELGARRGFPERPDGVAPRRIEDIGRIAQAIKGPIDAKIAILQEINAAERDNGQVGSVELDALLRALGPDYRYFIGRTGGTRRIAFIWDTRAVAANSFHEIDMPENRVADYLRPDSKPSFRDTFKSDPLVGRFTFMHGGEPRNDFILVGVDLAYGQWRTNNHDAAMLRLADALARLEGTHSVYPAGEADILIGGNFNLSPWDGSKETFLKAYEERGWQLLARGVYPPTRVSGSQYDFFIATRFSEARPGLVGEEIVDDEAIVHLGLAASGRRDYRKVYSDHFPVTTCIQVSADAD